MKKIIWSILFTILFVPFLVFADGTDKYLINIDIQSDGSIKVRELATMDGEYNGRFRTLRYSGTKDKTFTGSESDFSGSSIYNGSKITDIKVGSYRSNNIDFDSFDNESNFNYFEEDSYAEAGDYGKYITSTYYEGYKIKTFLPDDYDEAFFLEYVVKDVVVVHNDVAEIFWNIMGEEYEENIDYLEIKVNLPEEDKDMRVWLKGTKKTLNGVVGRTSDKTATIVYDFLGAYNPVTFRMMFNKELVPMATKLSNVDGKEFILSAERKAANDANRYREQVKRENMLISIFLYVWLGVMVIIFIVFYTKHDKEYKYDKNFEYYRELPSDIDPELVEYIMSQKTSERGFSASICNIIQKGVITVNEDPEKKKNYILEFKSEKNDLLSEEEKCVCYLLFTTIGENNKVTTDEIKSYGKTETQAKALISKFDEWKLKVKTKGKGLNIYENNIKVKIILCIIIGLILFLTFEISAFSSVNPVACVFDWICSIVLIIYIIASKKKTKTGIVEYDKWNGFKKFLKDFGRFNEKELPEIALWEKYLVYATVLGCAKEVEKAMKIRMQEMNVDTSSDMYTRYYYMNRLIDMNLNSSISTAMNQAVGASRSSIAQSRAASGDGFGGGSSFGGGFGGGGGGGGRF